jgi:hypothetical protein
MTSSGGAFSSGQSFFQDLLHYSDEHAKDNKELETTFALQSRLADFFKSNAGPILLKSQRYSGMQTNKGEKEPLGGPINRNVAGTNNLPGTGFCSPEFDFWGKSTGPAKKEIIQEQQNDIIEKYTNIPNETYQNQNQNLNLRENFSVDSSDTWWIVSIIALVIIIVCIGMYFLSIQEKPLI